MHNIKSSGEEMDLTVGGLGREFIIGTELVIVVKVFAHNLTSTPEPRMPYTVSVAALNSGGQGKWTTAGGVFFTMDLSEFSWKDHLFGVQSLFQCVWI